MAMKASALGAAGVIVSNITLFAVLIYELFGPMFTKMALTSAGDIKPEEKKSSRGIGHLPNFGHRSDEAAADAAEQTKDETK